MIHFISKVGKGLFTGLVEDDKQIHLGQKTLRAVSRRRMPSEVRLVWLSLLILGLSIRIRKKMDAMNLSLPGKIIWVQNGAFFTFFAIDYLKKIAELCKKDFMISENG